MACFSLLNEKVPLERYMDFKREDLLKIPLGGEFSFNLEAPCVVISLKFKRLIPIPQTAKSASSKDEEAFHLICCVDGPIGCSHPLFCFTVKTPTSELKRFASWRNQEYDMGVFQYVKDVENPKYNPDVSFTITHHNLETIAAQQQSRILTLQDRILKLLEAK